MEENGTIREKAKNSSTSGGINPKGSKGGDHRMQLDVIKKTGEIK